MLIRDYFKNNPKQGLIGLELECCGRYDDLSNLNGRVWAVEHDGSIGEGVELVLRQPLQRDELTAAVDNAVSFLKDNHYVESIKAGTHVHINVQDMNVIQLANFITAYYCVEPLLIKHLCGEARESNLFCLSSADAEYVLDIIIEGLMSRNLHDWVDDDHRYSSMNICAVPKYGSLEFRSMRAFNPEKKEEVYAYVDALLSLRKLAMETPTPIQIVNWSSEETVGDFLAKLLGDVSKLIPKTKATERTLKDSIRNSAQNVAFCVDWEKHFQRPEQKAKNPFAAAKKEVDHDRSLIYV